MSAYRGHLTASAYRGHLTASAYRGHLTALNSEEPAKHSLDVRETGGENCYGFAGSSPLSAGRIEMEGTAGGRERPVVLSGTRSNTGDFREAVMDGEPAVQ